MNTRGRSKVKVRFGLQGYNPLRRVHPRNPPSRLSVDPNPSPEFDKIGNFSISPGIPTASPFEKGGLRGIFPKAAPTY